MDLLCMVSTEWAMQWEPGWVFWCTVVYCCPVFSWTDDQHLHSVLAALWSTQLSLSFAVFFIVDHSIGFMVEVHWLSMVLRLHQHNIGYTADGGGGTTNRQWLSAEWCQRWLVQSSSLQLGGGGRTWVGLREEWATEVDIAYQGWTKHFYILAPSI